MGKAAATKLATAPFYDYISMLLRRKDQNMKLLMDSLGCDKNLVDSERMLGILLNRGYELTNDEEEAEAAIVNTCCFIDAAKQESIEHILELARLKETGRLQVLAVTGCMAQRYKDEMLTEIPEIDAIVGTTGIDTIADAIDTARGGKKSSFFRDASEDAKTDASERVLTTGGHFAYLKIAEGCDKRCTYCAIPDIRGHYRSYAMEDILSEARGLVERGVRELILVAEETTLYGTDLYGKKMLHVLLKKLCEIEELHWIRILYCYPEEIYPELIDVIASEEKICHYLDLPIQHASNRILKRMNRRTTKEDITALVHTLRERIPDIFLRTSLITGFPGETEEDHQELLDFIDELHFDRLGVFTYSKEEGTPAERMPDQIPDEVKDQRRDDLMSLQQEISYDNGQERIGSVMDAVVEGKLPEEGVYVCRTYGDAPDVDGYLFVRSDRDLMSGDFLKAKVTEASEYDLKGEEIIDEVF